MEDLSAPRRQLKISRMCIFLVLELRAGLLIIIWMASLTTLCCLVCNLEMGDASYEVFVGNVVYVTALLR